MNNLHKLAPAILTAGIFTLLSPIVISQTADQRIEALEKKIRLLESRLEQSSDNLDQQIRVVERKSEITAEETAAAKKVAPVVRAGNTGFSLASADGKNNMRLSGVFQGDYRYYDQGYRDIRNRSNARAGTLDENGFSDSSDTWILRRVRPTIQGALLGIYDFRYTFELGGGSASAIDAYIDARLHPAFKIRIGKHKSWVGLERLQSATDIQFLERSYVTNAILPNRDLGISVYGDVLDNKLNYAFGLNNGVVDGGNISTGAEFGSAKEITGRLFATPVTGLGFGIAATYIDQKGERNLNFTDTSAADATRNGLPSYVTNGQNTFFRYNGAVVADGERFRFSPQGYYYTGPFGIIAEYARVTQDVSLSSLTTGNTTITPDTNSTFSHSAWQISGSYILTGEDASFRGVVPKSPFDLASNSWGAWELVARYSELNLDKDTFLDSTGSFSTAYADLSQSAQSAHSWTVGLNWWLNQNVKVALNYEHTSFNGGAGDGILPVDGAGTAVHDRDSERAILARFQIGY